jgi:hypothetical protein
VGGLRFRPSTMASLRCHLRLSMIAACRDIQQEECPSLQQRIGSFSKKQRCTSMLHPIRPILGSPSWGRSLAAVISLQTSGRKVGNKTWWTEYSGTLWLCGIYEHRSKLHKIRLCCGSSSLQTPLIGIADVISSFGGL